MKKILILVVIVLFSSTLLLAQDDDGFNRNWDNDKNEPKKSQKSNKDKNHLTSLIETYKPMYVIFGDMKHQVKIQISFMIPVVYPYKTGLYFGYSQTMIWHLYSPDNPMAEINFIPEFLWKFQSKNNIANNVDLGVLDYIQVGFWQHRSNGEIQTGSKGWDRSYLEIQLSADIIKQLNIGLNIRGSYIWGTFDNVGNISDNPDIFEYAGYLELKVFMKFNKLIPFMSNEEIYMKMKFGSAYGGFDWSKGGREYGIKFKALVDWFRPYFFLQIYEGYGETCINYNQKVFAIRGGIIFDIF